MKEYAIHIKLPLILYMKVSKFLLNKENELIYKAWNQQ